MKVTLGQNVRVNTLYFFVHSEPSLAEKKALATAVSKQEAAQRLLGQCYCRLVLGLGLEDKHHLGCGRYDPPERGTPDFRWQGLLNGGKNQNPKKSWDQTLTLKISPAEFPSHKNFQKALCDITRKIEALVWNTQKTPSSIKLNQKNTSQNFPTQKNLEIENFKPKKILPLSLSLEIRSTPPGYGQSGNLVIMTYNNRVPKHYFK